MSSVSINQFELSKLKSIPQRYIYGKRGSGKTTLSKHILNYFVNYSKIKLKYNITVFTPYSLKEEYNSITNDIYH